jgi:hypothetical protein
MFGGALPQVTIDTYDRVMQGFDDWAKEAEAAANPEAAEPAEDALPGATTTEAE